MKFDPNSNEFKQIIREEAMRLKKRIMLENEKKTIVKNLRESGLMDEEEMTEIFGFSAEEKAKKFQGQLTDPNSKIAQQMKRWGIAQPTPEELNALMQQAAQDKYTGLWGFDNNTKKVIYRPAATIKWASPVKGGSGSDYGL